jgi:hypothetical protein
MMLIIREFQGAKKHAENMVYMLGFDTLIDDLVTI